jgi:hypothetical protein
MSATSVTGRMAPRMGGREGTAHSLVLWPLDSNGDRAQALSPSPFRRCATGRWLAKMERFHLQVASEKQRVAANQVRRGAPS